MKKHNFNAGPSILADEVIQNAAKAIVDFNGSGLSLLSISHRTKDFENVMAEADALFRELLGIPDNYKIFYIGGGASTFFYEVPANFLGRKAGYVNTAGSRSPRSSCLELSERISTVIFLFCSVASPLPKPVMDFTICGEC